MLFSDGLYRFSESESGAVAILGIHLGISFCSRRESPSPPVNQSASWREHLCPCAIDMANKPWGPGGSKVPMFLYPFHRQSCQTPCLILCPHPGNKQLLERTSIATKPALSGKHATRTMRKHKMIAKLFCHVCTVCPRRDALTHRSCWLAMLLSDKLGCTFY